MWRSIIYKEWLKLRWVWIILTLLGMLAVANIYIRLAHDILFAQANNFWYGILFNKYQYFKVLKFLPFMGLVLAVAQYLPETLHKRIKLTFHLPLGENKSLIIMMLSGTVCLLATYFLIFSGFYLSSAILLPVEIINSASISILPWILAGFALYYFVSLIVLEPVWYYWPIYSAVAFFFVRVYLVSSPSGAYKPINLYLVILTALLSIVFIFSAYRFRKGEMK